MSIRVTQVVYIDRGVAKKIFARDPTYLDMVLKELTLKKNNNSQGKKIVGLPYFFLFQSHLMRLAIQVPLAFASQLPPLFPFKEQAAHASSFLPQLVASPLFSTLC